MAVWKSFGSTSSNAVASCNGVEPFRSPPVPPHPGQPYTAADMEPPFTAAQLQSFANAGCGPFGNTAHVDLFRLWLPGDTFLVYPAVYTSTLDANNQLQPNNNIILHPQPDYYATNGNPIYAPNNITIRGVTQNGIRPVIIRDDEGGVDSESGRDVVEIVGGTNDTIINIGVILSSTGYVQQAGVYMIHTGYNDYDQYGNLLSIPVLGASPNTTTLQNMHISGFEQVQSVSGGANGFINDSTNGGTLSFLNNEVDHNGGSGASNSSGLAHGIYISASNTAAGNPTYDPNFTVSIVGNWFHDQFYGHDIKSRAQYTTVVGNYVEGGLPQGGVYNIADSYNLDVPNEGVLVAHGNIFVKNASGYSSGPFNFEYGIDGVPSPSNPNPSPYDGPSGGPRTNSISVRFNTFVAFSGTTDGTHPLVPFLFFNPATAPGMPGFPVANPVVDSNAFVGFCPQTNTVQAYNGTTALTAGFADMSQSFSFGGNWLSPQTNIVGTKDYIHELMTGTRAKASVGGED